MGGASNASLRHRWRANREDRMAWKMNGLQPHFLTMFLKPLRKVEQYVKAQRISSASLTSESYLEQLQASI